MEFTNLEKKYLNFFAPRFQIEVEDKDIAKEGMDIGSVSVDHAINQAGHFSFTINNVYDGRKEDLKWIDFFLPSGKRVKIKMGYGNRLELMFIGIITSIQTQFPSSGLPQLEISGFDLSYLLMKGLKPRSWTNVTHSEVVSRIALDGYNLKTEVEDTHVNHPNVVKMAGKSDFQLVVNLAESNYFDYYVFGETLFFRRPQRSNDPVFSLAWRRNLISFNPEINLAGQLAEVEVKGWNPKTKKEIVGKASIGDELGKRFGSKQKSGGELIRGLSNEPIKENIRQPVFSQEEADQLAKSILNNHAEGLVRGSGETVGIPELLPGRTIHLEGLGQKFSRIYYVEKTSHHINSSGYQTTFHVKESTI